MQDMAHEEPFFQPTEPLSKAIAAQNQRLVAESLQRVSPADELQEGGEDEDELRAEYFEGDESERDSMETSSLGREARHVRHNSKEQQTIRLQRLMGERLYHFLATLSESPHAREGGKFSIWEFIPQGMANTLGLAAAFSSHQPESERVMALLKEFTLGFRDWLVARNWSYGCAWGVIYLDEDDRLMLQRYAFDETQGEQACAQEADA